MFAIPQTVRLVKPSYAYGIVFALLLGFYLGLLFFVSALAATVLAVGFFRGKSRWMVGFGGGFFGLAGWFTVLLNHKEQYERVVAFLAQYLSKNWSVFVCDAFICSVGAMLFVGALAATHRGSRKLVQLLKAGVKGSKEEKPDH